MQLPRIHLCLNCKILHIGARDAIVEDDSTMSGRLIERIHSLVRVKSVVLHILGEATLVIW